MSEIREWFEAWMRERERDAKQSNAYVSDVYQNIDPFLFPSEIEKKLREQAVECENSNRDPRSGVSTLPKEQTLEWAAADLLLERKAEIDRYETMRETFINAWLDMRESLQVIGIDDD